jgi:hypothetical protein
MCWRIFDRCLLWVGSRRSAKAGAAAGLGRLRRRGSRLQWFEIKTTNERNSFATCDRPADAHETLTRRTRSHEMLANGNYSAWFRTPNGDGTAIVTLSDGTITGGDSFFEYSGSYEQNGDRLTATVRTRRVCDGPPSVFGIGEVVLKLEGRLQGEMVVCAGTAEQAPGVSVEVTLIPCREGPSPKTELVHRPTPFDATKLPKPPSR